jgi:hypothetical protein
MKTIIDVDNCMINQMKSAICKLAKVSKTKEKSKSSLGGNKKEKFLRIILLYTFHLEQYH